MKPLPAQQTTVPRKSGESIPSLPSPLSTSPSSFSSANRRSKTAASGRSYPWLLAASTATAALFCLLYITKPVVTPVSPSPTKPVAPALAKAANPPSQQPSLIPDSHRLPGEQLDTTAVKPVATDPRNALPGSAAAGAYEETNLRIQHILTAESPGGQLDRSSTTAANSAGNLRKSPKPATSSPA